MLAAKASLSSSHNAIHVAAYRNIAGMRGFKYNDYLPIVASPGGGADQKRSNSSSASPEIHAQ